MSKEAVRQAARARLRALAGEERAAAEREIAERVWRVPEVAGARLLFLFASLAEEVSTDAVAAEAVRRGIAVAFPRCPAGSRDLVLHRVSDPAALAVGRYGIREPDPAACEVIERGEVDAALVPGLAWDREGHRLGRGAGWYDRLFADPAWRGFRCGLFFSTQEVPRVPRDEWDAPLDAVVTENEVWRRE